MLQIKYNLSIITLITLCNLPMRVRFQDRKVCVMIERVYLIIQVASVAGSSIIQFGDIGVYYRKIRQGELSYSLTNAIKRQ
jgi:hypothetical protein